MTERKPDHAYLVTNTETGQKRLVRAIGTVAARNHAADRLFTVKRLTTGETIDAITTDGLELETAGESEHNDDPEPESAPDVPAQSTKERNAK